MPECYVYSGMRRNDINGAQNVKVNDTLTLGYQKLKTTDIKLKRTKPSLLDYGF